MADSITKQAAEEFLEQLLAEMSPEDEQYMKHLLSETSPGSEPLRGVVQNILDEPVPQEVKERLPKSLLPQPFQRTAPPRRRGRKRQEILKMFDPFHPENDDALYEGEERGRRTIRWRVKRRLGKDLTPYFMAKIRENVTTSFYARHFYEYQLHNIEDGTVILKVLHQYRLTLV